MIGVGLSCWTGLVQLERLAYLSAASLHAKPEKVRGNRRRITVVVILKDD